MSSLPILRVSLQATATPREDVETASIVSPVPSFPPSAEVASSEVSPLRPSVSPARPSLDGTEASDTASPPCRNLRLMVRTMSSDSLVPPSEASTTQLSPVPQFTMPMATERVPNSTDNLAQDLATALV